MIKLRQLINETIQTSNLTDDEGERLLMTKYRFAFWLFNQDIELWRGHRSYGAKNDYFEVFPSQGERESVDTGNAYTVLLGHLPSWKEWPKRSNSIIFANDINIAGEYGNNIMMIFPENEAKVVIAPAKDVLSDYSFYFMYDKFGLTIGDITNIDDVLQELAIEDTSDWRGKYERSPSSILSKEYKMLMDDLQAHTTPKKVGQILMKYKESASKKYDMSYMAAYQARIWKILKAFVLTAKEHRWNWEKFFDYILDPKKNNFKLASLGDFKNKAFAPGKGFGNSYEMWTDADCLLVPRNNMDNLKKFAKEVFVQEHEPD